MHCMNQSCRQQLLLSVMINPWHRFSQGCIGTGLHAGLQVQYVTLTLEDVVNTTYSHKLSSDLCQALPSDKLKDLLILPPQVLHLQSFTVGFTASSGPGGHPIASPV